VCDSCGIALIQRADDTPEVIQRRIDVQYAREIGPVLEFYKKRDVLREVEAKGTIDEVFRAVQQAIQ
jgi:adenylate kinase